MPNPAFTKGSTVEVSSDDPGFQGAWYVATVVDQVKPSPTKRNRSNRNRNQIRYLVKYDTLLNDDSLTEPLTETVDPSFVRPLPPRDGDDDEIEVGDVMDAYHREGWWIGTVKKVGGDGDGEVKKYVVAFENPYEEVEFDRSQLRRHVDWVDGCWQVLSKKALEPELVDRNAITHTLESNNDADSGFKTPSTGGLKKGRLRKNTESNSEMVGAVDASAPSSRNKRIMNSVEKDTERKRFRSSAGGSKENTKVTVTMKEKSPSDVIHQDSPPLEHEVITPETREAEDGKSHQKRRGRPPRLLAKRRNSSLLEGSKGNTKVTVTVKEKSPTDPIHQDSPPLEHEVITTPETHEAEGGKSPQKRRGRPPKSPAKRRTSLPEGSAGTTDGTTDYQQDWPFIKRSPIWATITSLELYQTPPQTPHFKPLKKMNEVQREGLAIAHMVTFGNLVQRLAGLKMTDPVDILNNSLETLVELESHGFDVGAIRGRLNQLLSLKSKVDQHEVKLKKAVEEIEKRNGETSLDEEMNEIEAKMQELQEKMVQTETMMKVEEEEIVKLQANLHLVSEGITDLESTFKRLAGTPLWK